ncbi:MAG: hypothetical protein ACRC7O_17185 [Fimbriiglobus sp.]
MKTPKGIGVRHLAMVIVGVTLLVAGAMKLHALATGVPRELLILHSPPLQAIVGVLGVMLGTGVVVAGQGAPAWCGAMIYVAGAAISNVILLAEGQTGCGCFGRVAVTPQLALGIDGGLFALLLFAAPRMTQLRADAFAAVKSNAVGGLVAAAAAVAVVGLAGPYEIVGWNPGEPLVIDGPVDFGDGTPDEVREATVIVRNRGGDSVSLIGGTDGCGRSMTADLPATIAPYDSIRIRGRVTCPQIAGEHSSELDLFTSLPDQPVLKFGYRIRVTGPRTE